jgi:hypothetical protein
MSRGWERFSAFCGVGGAKWGEKSPNKGLRIEPMNHSQIQHRAIAKTRKPVLPLLGGEGRGEGER